ncbi:VUT family protein [Kitasatospora sp. NPDC001574]
MSLRTCWGVAAFAAYAAAIVAANWLTARHGMKPVGFGLHATAGTFCAGAALMLRNVLQDLLGIRLVIAAIAAGTLLSAATSPAHLVLASGAAFLTAEVLDTLVYTPLRRRGWIRAVLIASGAGALVDTVGFLYLAGFPVTWPGVLGQLVGKTWAIWLPTLAVVLWRRSRRGAPCAT